MFGGLFGGTTPQYKGPGMPHVNNRGGMFGLIMGLFGGGGTPAYKRPTPRTKLGVGGELSPPKPASIDESAEMPESGPKAVTIVVRPGPGTSVDEVMRFLESRVLDD